MLFDVRVLAKINNFEGIEMETKRYMIRAFVLITSVLTICFAGQAVPKTEQTAEETNPKWLMAQDEKGLQFLFEYFLPLTPEQVSSMSEDELFALTQYDPCISLRGLRGVTVGVEFLRPEAEKYGLTREVFQTDTELRLRQCGIKVIPFNESSPLDACLYINVNTVIEDTLPAVFFAVNVNVEVQQAAMLFRNPKIWTNAVTWHRSSTMFCGVNKLRSGVRESVQDKVDEFINDYLKANPKK